MNKLYFYLHTLINIFKKPFLSIGLLLFLIFHINPNAVAQCNNSNSSGTVTAPSTGNTVQINSCAFAGDYSTINSVAASTSYTVSSSVSTDYITIRQGTPGGAVIAFGITPLTWTSTIAGTYYLHLNNNNICGTQASCRTTTITSNGNCVPPVVSVTPNISCGLPCDPLTASGADTYTWFPFAGLYLDCTSTIPYTGGNAPTVYARPFVYTTYTVTGTNVATGCSGTATAIVNYNPPAPLIIPNPASMCLGDPPVKLRIASSGTMQFCSGPVNIPVPDNNPAGVSNSIIVSGTPLNCNITGLSVTINMAHTRVGDMVFALKAPNGQIINLDYFISGTGGAGATTGFVNTNISWTGLNALSSGSNPYTGTFKADIQTGIQAGPTGMTSTATSWPILLSILNGTWTLGMYDGVSFETGTLNSWCLSMSFPCATTGSPFTTPGIWTPMSGLYTNAAGTQPYTGNAVDSVWAKPSIAGTFTYQVTIQSLPPTLPTCTSPPRSVVVTVNPPTTITTQPVDQNICIGSIAVFSVVASGVGPFGYQWQVSNAGAGGPYTNITNSAPYSGINTATLTINPVAVTMSGQYYKVIINGGVFCTGAVSVPALLTVNGLPVVVISANPLIVLPGMPTTIHSTVSPNPAATYTWFHNGTVVAGATADTLVVDINGLGDYQLSVTDINSCGSGLSNIISIADHFALTLFVYPNPTVGQFQARYYNEANTISPRSLIVYNNRGEKVLTKSFIQTISYERIDIDIRPYGKGLYWAALVDENGKRLAMSRVVVQ